MTFLYVTGLTVSYLLGGIQLLMLIRAIMSWIMPDTDNGFAAFVYVITEVFIMPFRKLCSRWSSIEMMPIDIPFMITLIVVWILQIVIAFFI